ncbi:hypothetical protein Y032_0005g2669 [Ancylostoma ceylanicum]|nr:hypothetical protein Y032_0005g2669 [Ancylostoma ceylanicum]
MAYVMYRETTLGTALNRTLEEFVEEGLITRPLAMKVLTTFDKNINKALAFRVKNKVQFKADKLVTYRYCDNVWTFVIDGVEFRDVHRSIDRTVNSRGGTAEGNGIGAEIWRKILAMSYPVCKSVVKRPTPGVAAASHLWPASLDH